VYYEVEETTWLHNLGIFNSTWEKRYIESFYWGLATFLLIGSKGDTFFEVFYCVLILLQTVGVFAYILFTIS